MQTKNVFFIFFTKVKICSNFGKNPCPIKVNFPSTDKIKIGIYNL